MRRKTNMLTVNEHDQRTAKKRVLRSLVRMSEFHA
jgi:hypothetical protein